MILVNPVDANQVLYQQPHHVEHQASFATELLVFQDVEDGKAKLLQLFEVFDYDGLVCLVRDWLSNDF